MSCVVGLALIVRLFSGPQTPRIVAGLGLSRGEAGVTMSSESTPRTASATTPAQQIAAGYIVEGQALELGTVVVDSATDSAAQIRIPLATINRHGLVAGATGTGKTKTLQLIAEQLSAAGVPVLMADVKGDLSGLTRAGATSDKITARAKETGDKWERAASAFRCAPPSPASVLFCCQKCWDSTLLKSRRWG
jgi:hypothetical protein